jgi:predicted alpha/beta superfamily hydrolase
MKILSREQSSFFSGTEVWLVHSDSVGDVFRVCVTAPMHPLPEGTRAGAVYVTDAGLLAGALVGTVRGCGMAGELPPLFSVSIGYALDSVPSDMLQRSRDLTPTPRPDFDPVLPRMMGSDHVVTSGGADAFLSFLVDELGPALTDAFAIDPDDATLGGVSLGGLFTLHAMLSRPDAFRRYLAVSPSVWWDDKFVLRNARGAASQRPAPDARLYMCAGEFESIEHGRAAIEQMPAELLAALPEEMRGADMHGDMFAIERTLSGWGDPLALRALIYPEETHISIAPAAISRGLRWLFGTLKR